MSEINKVYLPLVDIKQQKLERDNSDTHTNHSSCSLKENHSLHRVPESNKLETAFNSMSKPPPAWLSWTILAFSALNVIFLGGKRRAFGVFIAEFHHGEFKNTSLAELNWIGDSYAALGYLSTTVSTTIILSCNRNFRLFQFLGACFVLLACISSSYVPTAHWLFLTHTVFHGIGSSLILSTVGLVVNEHFDKNHKYHILATTLVSGGSVASIVFVQLYAFLIQEYQWRHAFVVLGILYFFVNLSGCLFFQRNETKTNYKSNKCSLDFQKHITPRHTPLLLLWTIDRVMTSIVTYGVLMNLADYLMRSEKKLTKSTSLTILFAAGEAVTYLLGAIITALTRDFLKNRLKYIITTCAFIMGASFIMWEFVEKNIHWSRILAFVSGFCLGPSITFLFPAGEEMTRLPGHFAYPFSLFGMGLGMSLSPTLSAVIAQAFKYKWFFMVQGCLIFIKSFCLLLIILIQRGYARNGFSDLGSNEDRAALLCDSDECDSESIQSVSSQNYKWDSVVRPADNEVTTIRIR